MFRGLTILEVVGHHTTGVALRSLDPASTAHLLVLVLNRTLHFAVPAFVFLSAVVLTRSLLKRFEPGRYFWRRLTRGGWPYLLWSALYIVWYVWTGQREASTLTDPERWRDWLLYGKASYHLYFLLVALEVYLVLPLLLPLARRRPSITAALLLGLALQLGLYLLNREVLRLPFPASTVLWYMLPITLGVAVGARLDDFQAWWRRRRWVLLPVLALAYGLYLPAALAYARGENVTPVVYSGLSWLYTSLVALGLLGAAFRLVRTAPLRAAVGLLGTVSLQIYLIHPAVLQALERALPPDGPPAQVALTMLGYFVVALLGPALLGRALLGTRLSPLLFGR
ncbi:acyltransferase family protein [Deinococcus multiflagellatus]|uniref:Acyltransferase family protein n=1 Tax=Deinococcus multiflagellatus TaxID=1656887 RepID=A0ABW1ZEU9_9DEIO|nr:acyltransferase [Deinococcus multiflagellatus]MBZ9712239.1 acyltransferase [Deinococcus multiflagellatus]